MSGPHSQEHVQEGRGPESPWLPPSALALPQGVLACGMRFLYSQASLSLGRTLSPSRSISFKWEMHSCFVSHSPTLAANHYFLLLRDPWGLASFSQVTTPQAPQLPRS